MAKRRIRAAELAGLAALGAFGYNFFGPGRDRKPGEGRADVEYRGTDRPPTESVAAAPAASTTAAGYTGGSGYADLGGYQDMAPGDFSDDREPGGSTYRPPAAAPAATRSLAPSAPAAGSRPRSVAPAANGRAPINNREQVFDAPMRPIARANPSARQYNQDSQGNRAGTQADSGPPITEEMRRNPVARIPGQRSQAPEGGSRVTGSETSRNIANALGAMGPTRLAGFGNAAIEGATARGALQRAAAARTERTEAARRGQTPTNLTSTKSRSTARTNEASKRTRKFDEDSENVEFKHGGKTKAMPKKMASGGMSSASKRADGIASKGKTKCKMY